MNETLLLWLLALNIPLYLAIGWLFFGDLAGFLEALYALVTGDRISHATSGQLGDRQIGRITIVLFVVSCAAFVTGEYKFPVWLFPSWGSTP